MKTFIQKTIISFLTGFFLFFPVFDLALAQTDKYGTEATVNATGGTLPKTIKGSKNLPELIGVIISLVLSLLGIVFFILIFGAGLKWMTAQGNSEKIDSAKNTIQGAAIGLVIILAAYAITNFVFMELENEASTSEVQVEEQL